ncbi:outer membrane lipid asymmetry maintenance protein MlaD [Thiohalophilus thiocyanatoxydans]|uniref:Phospholipid/cholesterol/gamma-HCH transport system substrate-binding protein n=1 Tax=Thiohalophilus thiocyanatoxydans TaxID=381308 RepID=A0A4R8IU03_9GAMM|nr:outer membrane lipid asymmetry maintenance protein MlaD [Thiohalophilus thiocyanatoxydans]TDY01099.1 phospholipid/cholesterol/gamma-HCH transport system substrate-binding protein [Thiohalophilus thiocyanatoxydans]
MMNSRLVEIWVGIFVAAGLAALFMLAMQVSNLSTYSNDEGYEISARFQDTSGLKVRSPVTMAGVTIGRVKNIHFDEQTFEAVVTLRIEDQYREVLPKDTSASIYTAGLLGEKYVGLEPGGAMKVLGQGDEIRLTQDSLVLEKLIGQFISRFMDDSGDN